MIKLVQKTSLDVLIESGDAVEINKMISLKETALINARTNMNYFLNRNQIDLSENERARVQLLERQIEKLKSAK
ncbi:hypothetical protein BBD31_01585 [Elizabethkingia anophelis]|uniref:hypothetical protein n=1 Tax=Elizabethkingia anophelis TaxID=1117645 RepID=UPI000994B105|nr:hypothetical protein [Elizabethkingia anophelis]AQW96666.1 hypothetical protein BBD31_01585 [Elizabethkingia anophelis]MDV3673661.1 hypothetical protein [Elizabethkingia anophelis]MDV3692385.1 hypothetical protein [Elizabethkingia anophelis]MDV3706658.1 hypothetical protein [Elizabethkingia anophelis]OPB50084.1 hypothetical protein BAY04_06915 [Elizabethkingia anophelis]